MKKMYYLLMAMVLVCTVLKAQPILGTTDFAVNGTISWNTNSPCVATKTADVQGWLVSVNSTSNCGINQSNAGSFPDSDGRLQYLVGFGTLSQASFGTDDGSEFALVNLAWSSSTYSFASKSISFVGYRNGLPVSGATLVATTGPSPWSVTSNSTLVNFSGNPNFSNVDNVLIIPTQTCSSILALEQITISTPSVCLTSPTVTLVGSSNVSCNGGSNGSATVSASGAGPFAYAWSPSGGTGSSASGLSAGVYTCAVTNSCSITSAQTVTITQPSAIVTSTAVTNVACNGGSNGVAAITASGGAGGYTYLWSNGATTSLVTGLLAGAYSATVTDANNCKSIKSAIVTQPSALVTSTAVTNVACNGGSNGVASITASGGAGSYTYLWSNGGTTSAITGILAGAYSATVTDANSCTSIKSAIITQPSALITATAVTNVACNGGSNGSATLTASGGVGGYTYLWSNGATTSSVSGLLAGAYSATVTDANSCTSSKGTIITQPSALITSTAVTLVSCNGGSNGSATITPTGGTAPYNYLWNTGATAQNISGALAGAYSATVTDNKGCTSIKGAVITQPSALVTNTAVTNIACNGGTGTSTLTASGGTSPYSYLWSNGATTSVISGLFGGVYTCTLTDANSCTTVQSVNVTSPSALNINYSSTSITCNGGISTVTISATGGAPAYTGTGTYTVLAGVSSYTVTDANSCSAVTTVTITQPQVLSVTAVNSSILCNGGVSNVTVSATGGTPSYTGTGTYTMIAGSTTYTVTDNNGCSTTATASVNQPAAIVSSQTATICAGQSYTVGSNTYTTSGMHTDVVPSLINGCDSTITSNLTVNNSIDVSTSTNGLVLSANNTVVATYQWLDCNNNNQAINGATASFYTASNNGSYAVSITENGCTATSTCVNITATGIVANTQNTFVYVYPNPNNGEFTIELHSKALVQVTDALGRIIYNENLSVGKNSIHLNDGKNGIYLIKIITTDNQFTKRIVVNK